MTGSARAEGSARDHLALALDVGDLDAALALAEQVQPWFGIAKVGFELYAGPAPMPSAPCRTRASGCSPT